MLKAMREKLGPYTLKNMQSMNGVEGLAWSATIYKGKVKVADAHDDGWGGGVRMTYASKELQAEFIEFAKSQNQDYLRDYPGLEAEVDGVQAGMMADTHDSIKKIERQCKTKTLFRLKNDDPDTYWTMKNPFDSRVAAHLRAKHGANLDCILNEELVTA